MKVDDPVVVGVPEIVTEDVSADVVRVKPAGSVPEVIFHVNGVAAPPAPMLPVYATPTVALGSENVMNSNIASIVMVNVALALEFAIEVAVTVAVVLLETLTGAW